jgi:hypothetical protein
MKTCSKCNINQSEANFNKAKNCRDGTFSWCKECEKIRKKRYHKDFIDECTKINLNKVCSICNELKNGLEYSRIRTSPDGLSAFCKKCQVLKSKAYFATPTGAANMKKNNDKSRDTPEKLIIKKDKRLQFYYKLTLSEFNNMLADQGNCCAICFSDNPRGTGTWSTDHDHATGKVRGLLCNSCNRGIGFLHDDINKLHSAIAYLEKHNSSPTVDTRPNKELNEKELN